MRDATVMSNGALAAAALSIVRRPKAKAAEKPERSIVWYRGTPYVLDLVMCRRALVRRQVEGELHNMTSLAVAARVSRSTASRFFSGRSTSLAATLRILKALRLEFGDVATPASADEIA